VMWLGIGAKSRSNRGQCWGWGEADPQEQVQKVPLMVV
jgi:hypothetical protein